MRIIAALLIILFYSPTGFAKTGNRVRGSSRAPGLEKAEDNYKTAKQLYYEALQLLDEAEQAEEEAQEGELAQIEAEIKGLKKEIDDSSFSPSVCGRGSVHVKEMCAEKRPICQYKKISDPTDRRGFRLSPDLEPGQPACIRRCDARYGLGPEYCPEDEDCITDFGSCTDCDILTESGKCQPFKEDDESDGSDETDEDQKFSPSVCGRGSVHVKEMCAEKRPICKYKKISDPTDKRGFRLSPDLEPGQPACIRRCDACYGLGPEYCPEDEDCITDFGSCTDCDILTVSGKCQPFKEDDIS